jgi:hypothetical protein
MTDEATSGERTARRSPRRSPVHSFWAYRNVLVHQTVAFTRYSVLVARLNLL